MEERGDPHGGAEAMQADRGDGSPRDRQPRTRTGQRRGGTPSSAMPGDGRFLVDGSAQQHAAVAAAATSGLTWQQQQLLRPMQQHAMLSATAAPFVPGTGQQRAMPPQQPGGHDRGAPRGGGGRGRGRGRAVQPPYVQVAPDGGSPALHAALDAVTAHAVEGGTGGASGSRDVQAAVQPGEAAGSAQGLGPGSASGQGHGQGQGRPGPGPRQARRQQPGGIGAQPQRNRAEAGGAPRAPMEGSASGDSSVAAGTAAAAAAAAAAVAAASGPRGGRQQDRQQQRQDREQDRQQDRQQPRQQPRQQREGMQQQQQDRQQQQQQQEGRQQHQDRQPRQRPPRQQQERQQQPDGQQPQHQQQEGIQHQEHDRQSRQRPPHQEQERQQQSERPQRQQDRQQQQQRGARPRHGQVYAHPHTAEAAAAAASMEGAAAAAAAVLGEAGAQADQEDERNSFTCVICCEPFFAVAVGACDHNQICARCCLRMRLCFRDNSCPLCKASNAEVVVTRPAPDGTVQPFGTLRALRPAAAPGSAAAPPADAAAAAPSAAADPVLWSSPQWAPGVLVVTDASDVGSPTGGRVPGGAGSSLHLSLTRMTAIACQLCRPVGRRLFRSSRQLQDHLGAQHSGRQMCGICLKAGYSFILEYPVLTPSEMRAHMQKSHPRCEFCNVHFYGVDEQYRHMNDKHFFCPVCQRSGLEHVYHRDAWELRSHMQAHHHMCEEPDCVDCLIAFATEDELKQHYLQRHSRSMPRWDNSRSRPMVLDLDFFPTSSVRAPRGGRGRAAGPGQGSGQGQEAGGRRQGGGGRFGSGPAVRELDEMADTEGGLMVIDDHAAAGGLEDWVPGRGGAGGGGAGGSRAQGPAVVQEDFPSLAAAAAAAPPGPGAWAGAAAAAAASSSWASASGSGSAGPGALRKATARCPCGRKAVHLALRDGEVPPPVACDRECEAAGRRQQLARAFDVEDPDRHTAYFDRHRTPTYSPALLQAAMDHAPWLESVEHQLASFLSDSSLKRLALPPMGHQQRALVHELAEEGYGLATVSTGAEPHRFIQLYKTPSSGMPTRTLMATASSSTRDQVAQAAALQAQAAQQLTLRFLDIAPGTNLPYFLREWAGEYTLTEQTGGDTASVLFTREPVMRACLAVLGGGIRGVFRIERPPPPPLALKPRAATAAAAVVAPPAPRPAAAAAAAGTSALPPTDRWLVVKKGGGTRRAGVAASGAAAAGAAGSSASAAGSSASTSSGGPSSQQSTSVAGPNVDPWADSQAPAEAEAAPPPLLTAPSDWEQAGDEVDPLKQQAPKGQPVESHENMWTALGEAGKEGAREEVGHQGEEQGQEQGQEEAGVVGKDDGEGVAGGPKTREGEGAGEEAGAAAEGEVAAGSSDDEGHVKGEGGASLAGKEPLAAEERVEDAQGAGHAGQGVECVQAALPAAVTEVVQGMGVAVPQQEADGQSGGADVEVPAQEGPLEGGQRPCLTVPAVGGGLGEDMAAAAAEAEPGSVEVEGRVEGGGVRCAGLAAVGAEQGRGEAAAALAGEEDSGGKPDGAVAHGQSPELSADGPGAGAVQGQGAAVAPVVTQPDEADRQPDGAGVGGLGPVPDATVPAEEEGQGVAVAPAAAEAEGQADNVVAGGQGLVLEPLAPAAEAKQGGPGAAALGEVGGQPAAGDARGLQEGRGVGREDLPEVGEMGRLAEGADGSSAGEKAGGRDAGGA